MTEEELDKKAYEIREAAELDRAFRCFHGKLMHKQIPAYRLHHEFSDAIAAMTPYGVASALALVNILAEWYIRELHVLLDVPDPMTSVPDSTTYRLGEKLLALDAEAEVLVRPMFQTGSQNLIDHLKASRRA